MYGHKRVREHRTDGLSRVGWEHLEVLLATWYRGQGYEVEHTGTAANGSKYDGGIDLKLRRPGEYVLVQIKHWNAYKVPHNDVHQLLGLMVNEDATGAILITSGEFTNAAIEAANRHGHVRLIDGDELRTMLGPVQASALIDSSHLSGRTKENYSAHFLIKGVFLLLVMFFVLSAVNRALHSVAFSLQHPERSVVREPMHAPLPLTPLQAQPQAPQTNSCRELVDRPSGTYIDRCDKPDPPKPPTAAEVRGAQRRADAAIKVLAPNTPEM